MNVISHSRGVITLAYGQARFSEQARDLALSLQLHAPHLPRALVTDVQDPELRSLFTDVIPYRPEWGSGVEQKMHLDHYAPYDETLFIDSDCLVLGNLDAFWSAFAGQIFGVPGFHYLRKGDVHPNFDVDYLLDYLNISEIAAFNGGAYYFTRSPEAAAFFETARDIMSRWRELRLAQYQRHGPADEAIYAVAMAIHRVGMAYMDPGGMWTPAGSEGPLHLDVLRGTCSFMKEGQRRTPEVIHFPGEWIYCLPYARERARLRKHVTGERVPAVDVTHAVALSVLWECSRRSSHLAKVGRHWIRYYRKAARALRTPSRGA